MEVVPVEEVVDAGSKDEPFRVRSYQAEMVEDLQVPLGDFCDGEGVDLRLEFREWLHTHWEQIKDLERSRVKSAKAMRSKDGGD